MTPEKIASVILSKVDLAGSADTEELLVAVLNERTNGERIVAVSAVLSIALVMLSEELEIDAVTSMQVVVELMGKLKC